VCVWPRSKRNVPLWPWDCHGWSWGYLMPDNLGGVFPIRGILWHPKPAQEVLAVADFILEHLREEHASDTGR
jgi:hypothetical protein